MRVFALTLRVQNALDLWTMEKCLLDEVAPGGAVLGDLSRVGFRIKKMYRF